MSLWVEIVNTVLIGCERKSLSLNDATGELGVMLAQFDQNDREGALLGAAALVSFYERAGSMPLKDEQPLPETCEPDDAPRCRERAAAHLAMALCGEHLASVPSWLWLATEAGLRAPEELLPELLEFGRKHWRHEPEKILPVLGSRGRWLAAQNPDWAYAADGLDETLWETKRLDQRSAFFGDLRKRDAARARGVLASCWEKESPKACSTFLSAFEWGLSLDDEAFLERALDDRRKDVRKVAVRLLALLPGSALCRRMFERARRLLAFKIDDPNRKMIEVTLPEGCDKAMRRDGVDINDYIYSGLSEKASWLYQMLKSIPPTFWSQESGWTVNELIEAANKSEWKNVLIKGWATAAKCYRDAEWGAAMLTEIADNHYLFDVLPLARQESLAIEELRTHLSSHTSELRPTRTESLTVEELRTCLSLRTPELPYGFIYLCKKRWSEALSRVVIDWLIHHLATSWSENLWPPFFKYDVPYFLNPAALSEAISRITAATKPPDQRAPEVERFLNIIQARYQMLNAF